jgi:hypothetical protein
VSEWNADNPQPFESLFERKEKEGREATKEWIDLVGRVADALEHYMLAQLLMQLQMQGFKVGPLPGIKHRAMCLGCNAIKSAKPDDRVVVPSGMPR